MTERTSVDSDSPGEPMPGDRRTEQNQYYRLLAENIRDFGMFITDIGGCIIAWNPGAEQIFGWNADEIAGQSASLVFTPDDRAAGAPETEMHTAAIDGWAADMRWHVRKDGSLFYAEGVMTALADSAGRLRGFGKVVRDATKDKDAEDALKSAHDAMHAAHTELQSAHDELEARVAERTEQLSATLEDVEAGLAERQKLIVHAVGAQEDERRRISRELHDQTGQHLTGLALGLQSLEENVRLYCPPETKTDELLQRLQEITAELARDIHRIAVELRPTALDDLGLIPALESYVEQWGEQNGVSADFESIGLATEIADALPGLVQITAYRVVQEALTNIARHALGERAAEAATHVSVTVQKFDKHLQVAIEDDGPGFDKALDRSGRLGIDGMRERAVSCGGTLEIETSPGAGTAVFLRVPIAPPNPTPSAAGG